MTDSFAAQGFGGDRFGGDRFGGGRFGGERNGDDLAGSISRLLESDIISSQSSLFATANPFKDTVPEAQRLNASLTAARDKTKEMLNNTSKLCTVIQEWSKNTPELTEGTIEAVKQNRDSTLKTLRAAQDASQEAHNALASFGYTMNGAQEMIQRNSNKQNEISNLEGQIEALRREDSVRGRNPFDVISDLNGRSRREAEIVELYGRIQKLYAEQQDAGSSVRLCDQYRRLSEPWIELARETSERLGNVGNVVSMLWLHFYNDDDAAKYKSIATADWAAAKKRAEQILVIVG